MSTPTTAADLPADVIIDGIAVPAQDGEYFVSEDPAVGKPLREIACGQGVERRCTIRTWLTRTATPRQWSGAHPRPRRSANRRAS
ncbi:hypothetical protein BH23ACT11_BH23ACT11_12050 [soil metagenome]